MSGNRSSLVGIVLIGRNEGDRLKRCVQSIDTTAIPTVYVDSGSSDDSVAYCLAAGIDVVELDMSIPFTAARARNQGFQRLYQTYPEIVWVQFVDGDCQLIPNWISTATKFLEENKSYAAVCGRRREISPSTSIYNKLCDIEWNTPPGDIRSVGGDAMFNVQAFLKVDGYREDLIAGEEPELCFRLRQAGWKIRRIDTEMTKHDAALSEFNQWWRRSMRSGYACAKGVLLHGNSAERYYVRPLLRIWIWAMALPIVTISLTTITPIALLLLLIYPLQYMRLTKMGPADPQTNRAWAFYLMLGKFAELGGTLKCLKDHITSKTSKLIEYK